MNKKENYEVDCNDITLKDFLLLDLKISLTKLKKVKFTGMFVNGEKATVRRILKKGDVVTLIQEESPSRIEPINTPLDIIFEDDDIIAVNKPTSMPTHPSRGNHFVTLANAVMAYFKDTPFVFRSVNRLDRDTSGIVLIAKSSDVAFKLSSSMKNGRFKKEYTAVIDGCPASKKGTINEKIAREEEGNIKRVVRDDGKTAITHYEVIKTSGKQSLVKILLETGRTHQIRVHFSYIGHPLSKDCIYGDGSPNDSYLLHATRLTFPHPRTDEIISLYSPPPFDI